MELGDLLNEIQAERKLSPTTSDQGERFPDLARPAGEPQWTPDDHQPKYTLQLSEYERYWLVWRLTVHLRSYRQYEWSEMKDSLTTILKRLEALEHGGTDTGSQTSPR